MIPTVPRICLARFWRRRFVVGLFFVWFFVDPQAAKPQGTKADYERANTVRAWTANKIFKAKVEPRWTANGDRFWYRNDLPGGQQQFVLVDAVQGTRKLVAENDLPLDPKPASPTTNNFPNAAAKSRVDAARWPRRSNNSPDGKWTIFVKEHNLWLRDLTTKGETQLSKNGTAQDAYGRVFWSPDSRKLVAIRTQNGGDRRVTLVESSPRDQLQPKTATYFYLKPGDPIPLPKPHLFDVATRQEIPVPDDLFPNPWSVSHEHWAKDAQHFYFVYNQRGHTVMRVLAINAATGKVSAVVNEACPTFFDYAGKLFVHYLDDTGEMLWMSERDGWNHMYLVNLKSHQIQPVTRGRWVVRGVDRVDEKAREIWFRALGIHPGQDPYHVHYCRAKFDGAGLVQLTDGDGTHAISHSPDRRFIIDTYSRVDLPPVTELRRTADGRKVVDLEQADIAALLKTGWRFPERYAAPGRDGKTAIHGYLVRPSNFDPKKKYPVIEHIYAGPHDHHVRKAFNVAPYEQRLAELGFIVVKLDGMGTNWRSKAFHDACWKNLADSGFPDRIAWIKAAASQYPEMDLRRGVGIFGGSAGGQSSTRALLAHGDFYTVAVSDCGCHDNRMDKIWWNELWMSWPVGPHYAEQSNVTNAHRLRGKLLLVVGELDRNVDPASTYQVANALIKADKDFDLLVIPGGGHGSAETPYGNRRRMDFFVRHLLGVEPRSR